MVTLSEVDAVCGCHCVQGAELEASELEALQQQETLDEEVVEDETEEEGVSVGVHTVQPRVKTTS